MEKLEVAISLQNLTKKFGTDTVLNNLNFDIPKNKITTILGFSGAGKSTLIKHILGLLEPTHGKVIVFNQNLLALSHNKLREFRRNFGVLFQYAALFDSLVARENVAFPLGEFTDYSKEKINSIVEELLLAVGIQREAFDKFPSELSGGMRKRVGLARALALSPQIMLYDEPTTGLDPITTRMVNELIVKMAHMYHQRGLTSVIISHDVRATLAISDFVAFLDHGKIIEYLPAAKFAQSTNPLVQEFISL